MMCMCVVASSTMHGLHVSHQQCCVGGLHAWLTTRCKCRSIRPLPAAAATRVDASSTSAASVYSYSVCQIDVMHARS